MGSDPTYPARIRLSLIRRLMTDFRAFGLLNEYGRFWWLQVFNFAALHHFWVPDVSSPATVLDIGKHQMPELTGVQLICVSRYQTWELLQF